LTPTVHVDMSNLNIISSTKINDQVASTLEYVTDARGNMPAYLSIKEINTRHDADTVVTADKLSGDIASIKTVYG
jgi:hypothetical protein